MCFLNKIPMKSIVKLLNNDIKRNFSLTTTNKMRFVQFKLKSGGPQHLGAQIATNGDIFDLSAIDSSIPNSLVKFLKGGNGIYEKAKR